MFTQMCRIAVASYYFPVKFECTSDAEEHALNLKDEIGAIS